MNLLAIDPGSQTSGIVFLGNGEIHGALDAVENMEVLALIRGCVDSDVHEIVCETVTNQGKRAGRETFEAARWYGRFEQEAHHLRLPFHGLARASVAAHLYQSCPGPMPKTPDARIRRALVARFGATAIHRVPGHAMAALSLAVTFADRFPREVTAGEWAAQPEWSGVQGRRGMRKTDPGA